MILYIISREMTFLEKDRYKREREKYVGEGLCKKKKNFFFPLNGIRRSLKLNFPFNKNNVTEDMVLKIH